MPGMTREILKGSELHRKLVTMLSTRIRYADRSRGKQLEKWQKAEDLALAYMPESDVDAARRNDRETSGTPRYTTIQVPYSYALMMASHTYLTSVFFARSPVHQFAGRHGEGEKAVQAVEALIAYQVEMGQFLVPYYIWVYDAIKYGLGIINTYWQDEIIQFSNVAEQIDPLTGKATKLQESIQIPGYRGNKIKNVSPFDFYSDPRFPTYRFQEGEFCAVKSILGWNEMLRRKHLGYYMNAEFIPNSSSRAATTHMTDASSALVRPSMDASTEHEGQDHPMAFHIYEVYVDLIQSEWGLGESNYPEKWVFTITDDLALIIGAQPLGSVHGKFPFDILVGEVEGYGLYTRGIAEIVTPVQNTLDWLINTHFYNVRAALNNQFIIDPSKIVIRDTEEGGPGFVYRLRPEAYGSDIRNFFYQVPVTDVTQTHINDISTMFDIGEKISGINEQMFGSMGAGRKTATEVRTSTGFGVNRQKTMSEYMSAMGMSPHAQKLVQHSQQWFEETTQFRIMGDLSADGANFINVSPDLIAGSFDLVPVDGTLPIDRLALANLWQQLLGQLRNFPQVMQQLDIMKLLGYVGHLAGIRNFNQFRIQVLPPGQAPGPNVVPLRAPGVPSMSGNAAGPGQNGLDLPRAEEAP